MVRVERGKDGVLRFSGISPILAWGLEELPGLLADDAPGIPERICPSPYPSDEQASREWERLMESDLAHLFDSARVIVTRDLDSLSFASGGFRIEIPETHRSAWLSALAAARVAQGESFEVTATDMDREAVPDIRTDKGRAILLIDLLGSMQALLIESAE